MSRRFAAVVSFGMIRRVTLAGRRAAVVAPFRAPAVAVPHGEGVVVAGHGLDEPVRPAADRAALEQVAIGRGRAAQTIWTSGGPGS